jgi:type IV secretory pathway VirB6-like protein
MPPPWLNWRGSRHIPRVCYPTILTAWPGWDGLFPLVMGAALWKQDTYYQVLDEDEYAVRRAGVIVTLGAISAAAGAVGAGAFAPTWHFAGALFGWSLAAAIIYGAALRFVPGSRPAGAHTRLLIALGFAYSPALLLFLGAVPIFGPLLLLGILVWIACTMILATMTALELEMEPATMLACAGWIPLFTLTLLVPSLIA